MPSEPQPLTNGDEAPDRPARKRKRQAEEDNLEDLYMARLAQDDRRTNQGSKKQRHHDETEDLLSDASEDVSHEAIATESADHLKNGTEDEGFAIPKHETLSQKDNAAEFEKASRTVFLGNVCTSAIKSKASRRKLLDHLGSFLPELARGDQQPKIESLRFRSTAFATSAMPKKAAFAKKELMDATTHSTNAYVVYSTNLAAREAARRLNGIFVLERHLRVDEVAHPAPIDHRRCVFVGNLGFVDDDSLIKASEDLDRDVQKKKRRKKPPADVEEGLWRQFKTAGEVESVRVVRDKSTRVGKGFAYVQFKACEKTDSFLVEC